MVGDVASQYAAGLTARAAGDGGGGALKAKADVAVARWLANTRLHSAVMPATNCSCARRTTAWNQGVVPHKMLLATSSNTTHLEPEPSCHEINSML